MKRLLVLISIALAVAGCKTQQFTMHDATIGDSRTVIRDTVMQHDSIYVREFMQGDTVFVTKYRDRWRDKVVNRTDTVYVLQAQPVLQSQRDGPSAGGGLSAKRSQFYKNCTKGFWILLILFLGGFALRIMKAIYLRK